MTQRFLSKIIYFMILLFLLATIKMPMEANQQNLTLRQSIVESIGVHEIVSLHLWNKDAILQEWRHQVNATSRKSKQLPYQALAEVKFARYQAKQEDDIWRIISQTSLNLDTVAQINKLSSVHDVRVGDWLVLPNMRGVLREIIVGQSFAEMAKQWQVPLLHLLSANPDVIVIEDKQYLFVPGGVFTALERSLFFGTAFMSPLREGRISSNFGHRKDPFTLRRTFHGGLDIAAPKGTPVYASRQGVVKFVGWQGGYGKLVIVEHALGYETYYGHLDKIMVKIGEKISQGVTLGLVGSTGRSTGPHLHYEIRRQGNRFNPRKIIAGLKHE